MEELAHHLRRLRVLGVPRLGEYEIVGADQLEAAVRHRLIDDDLRTGRVQDSAFHQLAVDVVEAHRAGIRPADAAELEDVSLRHRDADVLEALGRIADDLEKGARLLDWSRFVASICAWSSCAMTCEAPAPSMARASIECRIPLVNVEVFIVFSPFVNREIVF